MVYGITPKGFKLKTFEDIINEIEENYKTRLGKKDFKIDMYTPEGIHTEVVSNQIKELWEQLLEIVNNMNLDTATGVWLDKIGVLLKIKRRNGKFAIGTVEVFGDKNAVIPKRTELRIGELRYYTTSDLTLDRVNGSKYYGIVDIISETFGDVFNKSSGVQLESDLNGIEFITKTEIANGVFGENDTEYRKRLQEKREFERTATHGALKKSLENIETVEEVLILSPDTTPSTDVGTIKIYIDGDNTDEIFNVIARKKACGIITVEDENATTYTKNVNLSNVILTIKYNQIAKIIPKVKVEIKKAIGDVTTSWVEPVKQKVMNYINNLAVGESLDFLELYSEIRGIYEVRNIDLKVSVNGNVWSIENGYEKIFDIKSNERFVITKDDIEVI